MKVVQVKYYVIGRRKIFVVKVWFLFGSGKIIVNDKNMEEYFFFEILRIIVKQLLIFIEIFNKYDVIVKVKGGGFFG